MQPTNLTRSAPQASTTAASSTREEPVIAAQPTPAEKPAAGVAQNIDEATTAFATELAQVADDQPPGLQPDAKTLAEPPAGEADAEQWLLHMLEQQGTQLQARDAEQGSTHETLGAINAAAMQVLPRPLAAHELSEQAANQARKASPESLKASTESLKASTESLKASTESLNASVEQLATGKVGAAIGIGDARNTHLERAKLDPALLNSESANQLLLAQPDRLTASVISNEVATRLDTTLLNTPATESVPLERTLKLQGPETKWGEQLLQALRNNIELQIQQRVQNTTIRLDPPELGMMEIVLTHEQGRLNVQISAQHGDVVRLLQQTSDRLRHELVAQNFTQVDVEISGGQSGHQHSARDQARLFNEQSVVANLLEADQSDTHHLAPAQQKSAQHNGVLVTV